MVTVIDMITGEVIHSGRAAASPVPPGGERPAGWACPALALQEAAPEPRKIRMPPELAHIAVAEFLGKF